MGNKILVGSNFVGTKNRIINGGFRVWQRGEGFAGNTGYSADRMFVDNQGEGIVGKGKIALDSVSLADNVDPFGDGSGVALWKLDGNANDVSGNYNGTWKDGNGNVVDGSYSDGKFGQTADFGTAGSVAIQTDYACSSNDVISLWFNLNGVDISSVDMRLFNTELGTTDNSTVTGCSIYNGTLEFYVNVNDVVRFDIDSDSNWHHLVCDIGNKVLYLDGERKDILINAIGRGTADNTFTIGGLLEINDQYFSGFIGQVRILNRALTEEEIKSLYFEESKVINKPSFSHKITLIPDFSSKYIKPLEYRFEGEHLADLVEAKEKVTVSFTMNAKKSGTYSIALQNKTDSNNIETILQEFTYNGNEDERISITFDLSQFTTPVNYDENLGLVLVIGAYTEVTDYVGSVGLNSGEKLCTNNSIAYDNNDFVTIEQLQLEKGSYATEFEDDVFANTPKVIKVADAVNNDEALSFSQYKYKEYFFITGSNDITASSGVNTKLQFNTVIEKDDEAIFDTSNYEFVANSDGLYYLFCSVRTANGDSGEHARTDIAFYVNGNAVCGCGLKQQDDANDWGLNASAVLKLNKGDRVSVYYSQNKGTDITVYMTHVTNAGGENTYFTGFKIR